MFTRKNVRNSIVVAVGIVAFAATSMYLSSCSPIATCEDVPLQCSKSPYEYKACSDGVSAWWELNGTKYTDVMAATNAYMAYCELL